MDDKELKLNEEKENKEEISSSSLKERMQKVINASKKLDDDLTKEDPKKASLKEKLAKASLELEEEVKESKADMDDEELLKQRKAEYFAKKNENNRKRIDEMKAKLNAIMNEDGIYSDHIIEKEEEKEKTEEVEVASQEIKEEAKEEKVETVEEALNKDLEVSGAIVNGIVNEYREAKKEDVIETSKEDFSEITNDIKEELPELREEKVKKKHTKLRNFLDFLIKTMNGMAHGLFATLIVGTIIATIGNLLPEGSNASLILNNIGSILQKLTGFGIGLGVAASLGFKDLKLISLGAAGALTAYFCSSKAIDSFGGFAFQVGDPLTIYLVIVVTSVLMKIIFRKKTPVDIIIVPLFSSLLAASLTILVSKYTVFLTTSLSEFISTATKYQPLLMGIIIASVMGMALTAPISSAAIAATVFVAASGEAIDPYLAIAGGAALIGCCTQMLGFAIHSRKDNGFGTVVAIGIGTSMLQFKNILRKPIIWLPTILSSAILGAISTTVLEMKCTGTACGMGTSGLVGQIGYIAAYGSSLDMKGYLILFGFQFLAPIILVFLFDIIFRKLKLIKDGDFKI